MIHLILVTKGTYDNPPSGTPSANVKVPYLYPCPYALTNLALEAGTTAPFGFSKAVILDKNGNKYEYFPSIYIDSPLSLTNKSDYVYVRQRLIDAAHVSGLYPPFTSVSCPNGGEVFWPNLATNIVWDTANLGGNVKIELYKAGALNSIITASATNTGTYTWIIPASLTVATDYKIRVIPLNSTNQFDDSNANFAIRNAKMTVYYPNGGEKLFGNDVVNITWDSDSLIGNVDIDLCKSGSIYSTIAASTANDGSHTWTIPTGLRYDTNYTVRVTPQIAPSVADSSDAGFQIIPVRLPIYSANMSTNPGWTYSGSWAYGKPTGANQDGAGNPDPTLGYTGTNVVGYNLSGDYAASMGSTIYVTTKAVDCRGYSNVELQFMRWLGVETPNYDQASIQVSRTGTNNWVNVWTNSSSVNDGAWVPCKYDISATADGQTNIYIRWGMGKTDSSIQYCGWNIDDVQIVGVPQHTTNWTPYIWLASYGITNNQETADLLDSDGDGALNWQEYMAGTSPTNPKSLFCILDATFTLTANYISWYGTTNSGVTSDFIIYRTTNLVSGSWVPVGTNSRSPSGTNVWWDTSLPALGVPVYYKLVVP